SFGEFAAMYLSVWSDACWPRTSTVTPAPLDLPTDAQLLNTVWPDRIPTFLGAPLDARESRGFPDKLSPFQNYHAYLEPRPDDRRTPAERQKDYDDYVAN